MNKHLIERFKNGEIAINLETQDEWNEFMQWLEENTDLRWQSGHKPTGQDYWWARQKETGVSNKMGHFDIADYSEVYEIIKYKDLKERKGMKTTEFIKQVEELGYRIERIDCNRVIEVFEGQRYHGCVTEKGKNVVRTNADIPNGLFDLFIEYAKTPIEDREEEKKYYLRPKGMNTGNYSMVYWYADEIWGEESLVNQSADYQSTFTLKELEGLGIDVEHYDLEVVE